MRILLDTHMLLWFLNDPQMLPKKADELIFDPNNLVFVSSVSLWEIAIKTGLGKLHLETDIDELESVCERSNLILVSFHATHALAVHDLPAFHRDPFDRALIMQAQLEQMLLLTHDTVLADYGSMVFLV